MAETPQSIVCEFCSRTDPQCVPLDPPWEDFGICPACIADIPATEDCDHCHAPVDRSEMGLFIVVSDEQGGALAYRHAVCDVERRLSR